MKKIMLVFGTRPEAIKMCPLVNELKARKEEFETVVTVTGQHREMLDQVLRVFDVTPDHDLAIMKPGQTLFDVTCDVLVKLKAVLEDEKPDVVLVHGDTTTSFAAALACFYLQIPVGHVEAGLRTHDIYSPWPEEFNRQAVDIVSEYYFAPTEASKKNLLDEGKPESKIWVKAIYPIHMNPLVRKAAHEELDGFDRLHIIDPLEVLDFHNFMAASHLILTDSGGIQEEAPSLGKPVLVMRDTTERPEGVAAGTLKLVGTEEDVIYREFSRLLSDQAEYEAMSRASNPYGDGRASERIADVLAQ